MVFKAMVKYFGSSMENCKSNNVKEISMKCAVHLGYFSDLFM